MTIKDSYPLPKRVESIDSLGTAKVFSTPHTNWLYLESLERKADRVQTAFFCHAGPIHYNCMPSRLATAPATVQHSLDLILAPWRWNTGHTYLDDITLFSKHVDFYIHPGM